MMNVIELRRRDGRVERVQPRSCAHCEVTLLFSDIVGFSEMTERLGDRRAYEVVCEHHRVVRSALAEFGGQELELRGDGFLLAFPTPEPALDCAVAIQRELAQTGPGSDLAGVRVRMGLHTGPALCDPNGFFGKTVIVASRIADRARGGEILVSSDFRARLGGAADGSFSEPLEVELKGFHGGFRVQSVGWSSAAARSADRTPLPAVAK